ncbi:MAG: rRNA maturation RNase YbeY [Thermoleophilia bacterium]|nr:rRNA maturation RNase YbeY [Thermoleophilia bacterium]
MSRPTFQLACTVTWDDDVTELLDERRVQTLVAVSLYEAGVEETDAVEVGISFCGLERIAELNVEHRDVTGPTDVLSFPIDGLDEQLPPGMPRDLGDVVVAPAYVQRQLADGTTMQGDATLAAAIERCVVHGVLHLCGFDHERGETHALEMLTLEQLVLDRVRAGAPSGSGAS